MTRYFHGSSMCDLPAGDWLLPASVHGGWLANPRLSGAVVTETYADGVTRHDHDLVWLCENKAEADRWGGGMVNKMTGAEVRAEVRRRGRDIRHLVYEVKPDGPLHRRADPHSPTEVGCARALIVAVHEIHVYEWEGFYETGPNGEPICPYTGQVIALDSVEERDA